MGKVSTVTNQVNGQIYTISTVTRNRNLPLPELGSFPVNFEAMVLPGKSNPAATIAGKKPVAVGYSASYSGIQSIDEFHDVFVSACEQLDFSNGEELAEMLASHGIRNIRTTGRQLMYGMRTIDFIVLQ